jgi:hypothetical protein
MSHFTEVKTTIKNAQALKMACSELGLELIPNGVARGYRGQTTGGDYVLRLKGPYDVSLIRQDSGDYALKTDFWQGHVEKEIGKNGGMLLQSYGVAAATLEARKQGYSVSKRVLEDGSIKLTVNVR